jgi:hypothetical protein
MEPGMTRRPSAEPGAPAPPHRADDPVGLEAPGEREEREAPGEPDEREAPGEPDERDEPEEPDEETEAS